MQFSINMIMFSASFLTLRVKSYEICSGMIQEIWFNDPDERLMELWITIYSLELCLIQMSNIILK